MGGVKHLAYLRWHFQIHWDKLRGAHPYTSMVEVIICISKARWRSLRIAWGVLTPLLVLDTEIIWKNWILNILVPAAGRLRPLQYDSLFPISRPHLIVVPLEFVYYFGHVIVISLFLRGIDQVMTIHGHEPLKRAGDDHIWSSPDRISIYRSPDLWR